MRRLNLVLLASLQLCRARQPGFSIHDDLLAHPQFEVVFADDFISEAEALALLESSRTSSNPTSDVTNNVRASAAAEITTSRTPGGGSDEDDEDGPVSETYELINGAPWRYLCSVPVIRPPPALNQTATELAKAEEARELSRASAKGWELMSELDGHCMYFMSGWWSYSYCYGKGVVQFHAAPSNKPGPPVRDEGSLEYILGKIDKAWNPAQDGQGGDASTPSEKSLTPPPNSQLQIKGDQRYLSQRLEYGTICDITDRPRTIEIQYHCSPGTTVDRIGWIKEVTTCNYLMVVYTPRLCADVAFQPPKETRAHPIRCRQIVGSEDEESAWRYHKRVEAGEMFRAPPKAAAAEADTPGGEKQTATNQFTGLTIGGVVVGGKKIVSDEQAAKHLPLPRGLMRGQGSTAGTPGAAAGGAAAAADPWTANTDALPLMPGMVLAHKERDAAVIEMVPEDELVRMGLDPAEVDAHVERLQREAGEREWKLVIELMDGEYEYVGVVETEDGGGGGADQKKQASSPKGGKGEKKKKQKTKTGNEGKAEEGKQDQRQQQQDEQDGSQEVFFKEEL